MHLSKRKDFYLLTFDDKVKANGKTHLWRKMKRIVQSNDTMQIVCSK